MRLQNQRSDFRRIAMIAVSTAALMWVLLYAPTPYVVYEPGIAVPVKPMVTIENGDSLGKGDFLLTAVKMTEPNFLQTILTMWNSNMDVHLKRDVLQGFTKEQYAERLSIIMQGSQNNAIEAAYHYAGLPYTNKLNGFVISKVNPSDHAVSSSFQAGDKLHGIHGEKLPSSMSDLLEALIGYNKQQNVLFDVERKGKKMQVAYSSDTFKSITTNEQLLSALGIVSLSEQRSLDPADHNNRINIKAGDIGGPSAGLVFALQSLDLLTNGDLSGGHRIAATGTITVGGQVGAIGGIKQKVVIASEEDAELFLVPSDNFEEAEAKAKELNASMKIVSVSTLQEAVDEIKVYLAGNER